MKCFVFGITVFFATVSLGSLSAHGDIITADVAVLSSDGQYAVLASGEQNSDWYQYVWCDVPAFAAEQDVLFWQYVHTSYPTCEDGDVIFEVLSDGPVLMACTTRWGGGGNSSGDWEDDLITRAELEKQGWSEFATGLSLHHAGYETEPCIPYVVFSRDCVTGEIFSYRTEKYEPPVIIRSINTTPEPSAIVLLGMGMAVLLFPILRKHS